MTIDAELTTILSIGNMVSGDVVLAEGLKAVSLTANGNKCAWTSKEVVTGVSGSLRYMDSFNVVINASTGATRAIRLANGVNVSADTEMIYYMTWA